MKIPVFRCSLQGWYGPIEEDCGTCLEQVLQCVHRAYPGYSILAGSREEVEAYFAKADQRAADGEAEFVLHDSWFPQQMGPEGLSLVLRSDRLLLGLSFYPAQALSRSQHGTVVVVSMLMGSGTIRTVLYGI